MTMTESNPKPSPWPPVVVAAATLLLVVTPFFWRAVVPWVGGVEDWGTIRLRSWLTDMVLILVVVVALGHAIRGGWFGWLVDQENRMSLTRLQIVLWTTLTVAAVVVAGVTNLLREPAAAATAFALVIPAQLWLLLGINVASATGTTILLGSKRAEDPTPRALVRAGFTTEVVSTVKGQEVARNPARTVRTGMQVADGIVTKNETPEQARFIDLFSGDELANSPYLDVGKVQMFLFTAIAVVGYALAVGAAFAAAPTAAFVFPAFSESLLTLIAVSHAGYLANLAPNRTETEA
jgi:hypothetical protein